MIDCQYDNYTYFDRYERFQERCNKLLEEDDGEDDREDDRGTEESDS